MYYKKLLRFILLGTSVFLLEFGPYSNTTLKYLLQTLSDKQQLRQDMSRQLDLLSKLTQTQLDILDPIQLKLLRSRVSSCLASEATYIFNG